MTDLLSSLATMEIQVQTLFACTPDGRLLHDNDPFPDPVTDRFFLGRTPDGNVWRMRHDLPEGLVQELEVLARSEPVCPHPGRLPEAPTIAPAVRAALRRHAPIRQEHRGPAYYLPPSHPLPAHVSSPASRVSDPALPSLAQSGPRLPTARPPAPVLVTEANAALLEPEFADLRPVLREIAPCIVVLASEGADSPRAVTVCFSSRISGRAAEAGVETLEPWRRRGLGGAAVAAWGAATRKRGLLPLYSTSWSNTASQALARRLGFVLFGEDFSLA